MNSRLWLITGLVASLSLNLLVAGVLIGRGIGGGGKPPPLDWAVRSLDARTRAELRPLMSKHVREISALRQSVRESNDALLAVIAAEPLDEQALQQALADIRRETAIYQQRMHVLVQQLVVELPREQRQQVLGMLLNHRGGPSRGAGSEGPPRPPRH